MSVQVKLGVSSEVTQDANMFCENGICWFLIMYSFLVGPQVAICRSIVNTLDPIRFDVTVEIFPFRNVLKLCGTPTSFCSWMIYHTNWKGMQLVCGHHNCGHWEGFPPPSPFPPKLFFSILTYSHRATVATKAMRLWGVHLDAYPDQQTRTQQWRQQQWTLWQWTQVVLHNGNWVRHAKCTWSSSSFKV